MLSEHIRTFRWWKLRKELNSIGIISIWILDQSKPNTINTMKLPRAARFLFTRAYETGSQEAVAVFSTPHTPAFSRASIEMHSRGATSPWRPMEMIAALSWRHRGAVFITVLVLPNGFRDVINRKAVMSCFECWETNPFLILQRVEWILCDRSWISSTP